MELLNGPSLTHILNLTSDCKRELSILTRGARYASWPESLERNLVTLAKKGVKVRILFEGRARRDSAREERLRKAGVQLLSTPLFASIIRSSELLNFEIWISDRSEILFLNERGHLSRQEHANSPIIRLLLGPEAAEGLGSYFESRWKMGAALLDYSVKQKNYTFQSRAKIPSTIFSVISCAQYEIALCMPKAKISPSFEKALIQALQEGKEVKIFTNSPNDPSRTLRKLHRLSNLGAKVKICAQHLNSECIILDQSSIYVGALPHFWRLLPKAVSPSFMIQDANTGHKILAALEAEVALDLPKRIKNGALHLLNFRMPQTK